MADQIIPRREINFHLFEVLDTLSLCEHEHFSEHSSETYTAMLDTAEKIAEEQFAPHNAKADKQEPVFDGHKVSMIDEVKQAYDAYCEAGFIAAGFDFEDGGLQLPTTVKQACAGYFKAANPSTSAYPFLTAAAANVVKHFASDTLREAFLPRMLTGEFTGTMALTEPHAGSSLSDITTTATPHEDGNYRLKGSKIYISGGEHELSDNIVHLVLAKIPGGPAGVKGISLFLVPKYRLDAQGQPAQRNDVALAGLIHKMGYRGTTSTALSFGDNGDCHGYLIGEPHKGLRYMFMMMNEARIGVGYGAALLGYRGYQFALEYARDRVQGRKLDAPSPDQPACTIIHHPDVRRMLLAQKAYSEGGMALCLYGARLIDEMKVCTDAAQRDELAQLLDLLTPVIKAWPSAYGPKANDLAIQVFGGAGYTREYPVEQCWRDNRLNPIHEGTNGIQALDLLARKLWQAKGSGLKTLQTRILQDIAVATGEQGRVLADKLSGYLQQLERCIGHVGKAMGDERQLTTLGNAQCFMNLFSSCVMSWIWLRMANVAEQGLASGASGEDADFYRGKIAAARYFIDWELPLVQADVELILSDNAVCFEAQDAWL